LKDTAETTTNHRPIPTPLRVRWLRFRHQLLPVVTVICCAALAAWLWTRHAGSGNALGEVEARRVPVTSTVDGVLAALTGRAINPHDRVSEGDVVATIDPAPVKARRAARQVEVDRLRAEIQAAEAQKGGAAEQAEKLKSLREALTSREEEVAQLDLALSSLDITAPVSGTVSKVHLRPGQLARAGDPIMEISADGAGYVVSYLREEQQYIQPAPAMPVEVRPRNNPKHVVRATVDTVGAQVEAVPARQLRDQRTPEWGLPVRVTIPPDADLLPGEIVNLVFKKQSQ
jgi:multidrug resistance efflux pump